jgi:rifampicin phosphotransferase
MPTDHVMPAPVRLAVPPDFPVTWASDDEQQLPWVHDRMHAPHSVVPLDADFWTRAYGGLNAAADLYEMPIRARARTINTYVYSAVTPAVAPEQMEAQAKRGEERIKEAFSRLETSWTDEWLPEIQSHLAWWASFDLRAASVAALRAHLEETLTRMDRLWEIHFRIVLPVYAAISQFDELYRDLFPEEGAFSAYLLLQGFDNKTLETSRELWTLSRKVRALPDIQQVLDGRPIGEFMEALDRTPAGRAFKIDLQSYLTVYGQRGDTWGFSYPGWLEDPSPVIRNLQDYASQADRDAAKEQARLVDDRERAIAHARERLKGYPQAVRDEFELLLKAAQCANVLTEDHGFWIDFNSTYQVRRVVLEFGRRLADAGVIDTRDDVFYLVLDELRDLESALANDKLRERVVARRSEVELFRTISPPPVLGTDYGPPPDDPMNRSLMKFFGAPPPASDAPDVLKGHAGSPGTMRGRARILHRLDDADKLQQGDVLVAETTAPPWTPLFATAGGIVTDTGGILSHCAVVAREYRIPAVVGTGRATAVLRDGQLVEVDGDTGTVRIIGD